MPTPVGPRNRNEPFGRRGSDRPGARTTDRVRDDLHRFVLADDALVQRLFHAQEFFLLALEHFRDRNAGPLGNHLGDFLFGHLVADELGFLALGDRGLRELALERGQHFVLDLRHAREIALAAGGIHLLLDLLLLGANVGRTLLRCLLALPDLFEVRVFLLEAAQRLLQSREALFRGVVFFLLERFLLDLELDDAALEPVEHFGLRIHLHADARTGFVDQVDSLVRQLTIGDVAMRERGRRDDGGVGDLDVVVRLVALLQSAKDRDGVFDGGLVDEHFLEAALERGVLLDVLAVFVERGRAHAMQLAARQRGLEHVAGVHGAFGLARADHGVQLVDEQDDLAFLLGRDR